MCTSFCLFTKVKQYTFRYKKAMKVLVVSKIVVPLQTLSPPNNYNVKS